MPLEFRKISEFRRGTLAALLTDAYSFDCRCAQYWSADWREFDDFFFEHLQIADRYGFITVLDGEAIGLASWDPRLRPEYVEIGHNCIAAKYKGHGYGKVQLQEAVDRISRYDNLGKIIVTTNGLLLPAQRMYERHTLLTQWLEQLGVSPAVAAEDACRMEHVISAETFAALKAHAAMPGRSAAEEGT